MACSNGLKFISQRAIPLGNRIVKTFIRILDLIQKIKQPSWKKNASRITWSQVNLQEQLKN